MWPQVLSVLASSSDDWFELFNGIGVDSLEWVKTTPYVRQHENGTSQMPSNIWICQFNFLLWLYHSCHSRFHFFTTKQTAWELRESKRHTQFAECTANDPQMQWNMLWHITFVYFLWTNKYTIYFSFRFDSISWCYKFALDIVWHLPRDDGKWNNTKTSATIITTQRRIEWLVDWLALSCWR